MASVLKNVVVLSQILWYRYATAYPAESTAFHSVSNVASNASLLRRFDDTVPPGTANFGFVSLGESFAAGIGAGDDYPVSSCGRAKGAYAPQFERSAFFQTNYPSHEFHFDACSGSITAGVASDQLDNVNENTRIITISTGGNDANFGNCLRYCFIIPVHHYGTMDCNAEIDLGFDQLFSAAFFVDYEKLIDRIQSLVKPSGEDTLIYHTGYPQAFDDYTTQCNETFFGIGLNSNPEYLAIQQNRRLANELVAQLNVVNSVFIDYLNSVAQPDATRPSLIRFVDVDERYTGHRRCREGTIEPDMDNPDIWLFYIFDKPEQGTGPSDQSLQSVDLVGASAFSSIDTSTCSTDGPKDGSDNDDWDPTVNCAIAKFIAGGGTSPLPGGLWPASSSSGAYGKTFHPRINGHAATSDEFIQRFSYRLPGQAGGKPSGKQLKILAIGDSITDGYRSSEGSGYRKPLYDILTAGSANQVEFVGTLASGTANSAWEMNEGFTGALTQKIIDNVNGDGALDLGPNIILLMAGTNDVGHAASPNDLVPALTALENWIYLIVTTYPDAVVFLAHINPIGLNDFAWPPSEQESLVIFWNGSMNQIVNRVRARTGAHILKVHTTATVRDHADGLHPNDRGYQKMAYDFAERIADAEDFGWIGPPTSPITVTGLPKPCTSKPNWIPQGQIANGAGFGQAAFPDIICTNPVGTASGHGQCECTYNNGSTLLETRVGPSCAEMSYYLINAVHFADLNGDGRAEYLWVGEDGEVNAYYNQGPVNPRPESTTGATVSWAPAGQIAAGIGGKRWEIQFADLNGDGRADYLWVRQDGSVEAYLNGGQLAGSATPANVNWLPQGLIASGIGYSGSNVHFADLNGDGRAEYLAVHSGGAVDCYLNGGSKIDNGPHAGVINWLPQGTIAGGVGGTNNETVFADINGDGKAEYLEVSRTRSGSVNEWRNDGGPDDGPNAAKINWEPLGSITGGDGTPGARIMFADLNGDGRAEYIEVDPGTSAVSAYLNGCTA